MTKAVREPKLPPYEILGVGTPCLDYILKVSPAFMKSLTGSKEGMVPVDYPTFRRIIHESGVSPVLVTGGSACNTIKGLARLGRRCALAGKIGTDPVAHLIRDVLKTYEILPLFSETATPSSQVAALVAPDGSRTFRTFLGAGAEMSPSELNSAYFKGVKLVHIEGYSLANGSLTEQAMALAKTAGALVSFDLSSFELVERFRPTIIDLIQSYVDVLFANEHEVQALVQVTGEEGADILRSMVPVAVIFQGKQGCIVGCEEGVFSFPAYPVEPIDTTGAGDLFASGFLHGYLQGKSWQECAHYGALLGAAVVQVQGAEIPDHHWEQYRF